MPTSSTATTFPTFGTPSKPPKITSTGLIGDVTRQAQTTGATGKKLTDIGGSGLESVLKMLQSLASGNPAAVEQATQPQRAKIIEQYDTARQTAERNAPRGGGQAAGVLESFVKEGSQIASTKAEAVTAGMTGLADVSTSLISAGLNAESASAQELSSLIGPMLEKEAQKTQAIMGFFGGVAKTILSAFLPVPK